jgi:hypothetical protein
VFGHAIFEHLATAAAPVRGFPIELALSAEATNDAADRALAAWIGALDADAIRTTALRLDRAG